MFKTGPRLHGGGGGGGGGGGNNIIFMMHQTWIILYNMPKREVLPYHISCADDQL